MLNTAKPDENFRMLQVRLLLMLRRATDESLFLTAEQRLVL